MKKFILLFSAFLICTSLMAQMSFEKEKEIKSVVLKKDYQKPEVKANLLLSQEKEDDNLVLGATISCIAFATILTASHWGNGSRDKEHWPYWGAMGSLATCYIAIRITLR